MFGFLLFSQFFFVRMSLLGRKQSRPHFDFKKIWICNIQYLKNIKQYYYWFNEIFTWHLKVLEFDVIKNCGLIFSWDYYSNITGTLNTEHWAISWKIQLILIPYYWPDNFPVPFCTPLTIFSVSFLGVIDVALYYSLTESFCSGHFGGRTHCPFWPHE